MVMLEPDSEHRKGFVQFYRRAFDAIGYQLHIDEFSEVKEALRALEDRAVDVFVSDVMLERKSDIPDGLSIIKKTKDDHPDVFVIAQSRAEIRFSDAAKKVPSFDLFVHKTQMPHSEYLSYVASRIRELWARNVYVAMDWNSSELAEEFRHEVNRLDLVRLLRSATFASHVSTADTAVARVVLKPLPGGMSQSQMYRMHAYTARGLQCVNAVLKISPARDARQELDNYYRYVKWYLPYTWRAELIGYGFTKKRGALCYSFIYNDEKPYGSMTSQIAEKRFDRVELAVKRILNPQHQRWYHPSNRDQGDSLTDYYVNKWFGQDRNDVVQAETALMQILVQAGAQFERDRVTVGNRTFPLPQSDLLGTPRTGFTRCICHGDLNSNNILISDSDEVAFIDFQDVGRGHVFEDFVALEGCLRLHCNEERPFAELLEAETALWDADVETLAFGSASRLIRRLAKENCPEEADDHYRYALALDCFALLRFKTNKEWQRQQLAACVMAALPRV